MLLSSEQLVELIHDAPRRIVLAASGGGSRAVADLLEVPGGSRTLLEAVVPYAPAAMDAWLGGKPDEYCSSATARAMAMAAYYRARRLDEPAANPAGVGCTASLASDRPKRGPHRIHVALQTDRLTAHWQLQLHKGRRSRAEEERLAGQLVLNVVAEACELSQRIPLELLEGEQIEASRTQAPTPWRELLAGQVDSVCCHPTGRPPRVVFPGAFNPLHAGHRRMAEIARELLREPAAFELSITNVDKPPLDFMEIERRVGQFSPEASVYLTRAATFEEKSRLFPGATFIVGADTLARIAAPGYYGGDTASRLRAIKQIAARGCRFLLFDRLVGDRFLGLSDLDLPEPLRALCRETPPELFRDDISSTAVRKNAMP